MWSGVAVAGGDSSRILGCGGGEGRGEVGTRMEEVKGGAEGSCGAPETKS